MLDQLARLAAATALAADFGELLGVEGTAARLYFGSFLDVQARILAATLVGELPQYTPMVTR